MAGEYVAGVRGVAAGRGWDWIARGWSLFKKQPGTWLAWDVALVALVLVLILAHPIIGRLLLIGVSPLLMGGIAVGCRELDEGRALQFGQLFAGFRLSFGALAAVGVICAVATALIAVGVVFGLGVDLSTLRSPQDVVAMTQAQRLTILLALLIMLALLLPVTMAAWFAPLLVIFQRKNVAVAMRDSFVASVRNIAPMLVYGLVLFVLMIAATMPVLLGWILLLPVLLASIYTSYKDIFTAA